jgi:hypothetical protein
MNHLNHLVGKAGTTPYDILIGQTICDVKECIDDLISGDKAFNHIVTTDLVVNNDATIGGTLIVKNDVTIDGIINFNYFPDTIETNSFQGELKWPTMTADREITLPDNSGTVCVAATNGVTLDSTVTMRSTTVIITSDTTLDTSGTWYVNGSNLTVTIDPSNVTDNGIFITLFGVGGSGPGGDNYLKNTVDTNSSIKIDKHDTAFIIIKGKTTESDIIVRKYHAGNDESWTP